MAVSSQINGVSGTIAEVKAGSVAPVTATDNALVTVSRPDDPIITTITNGLINDVSIVGQGGQLALGQNIVNVVAGAGSTDCTAYRALSLEIVVSSGTVTAGNIIFEGSNDGANFIPLPLYDKASPYAIPITTYAIVAATSRYFIGNVPFRYFRARISTGITGTTTGVQCFAQFMSEPVTFINQMVTLSDGTRLATIKAASTAAVAADPALVVSIAGANSAIKIGDGTNNATIKAASTGAVAADPTVVVALSPNLPVPTVHTLESAATTNATIVKASAGRITSLVLTSPLVTASIRFFKLYNKASAPTVGTDVPVMTIPFATVATNGGSVVINADTLGMYFSTGIAYAITGLSTTADTTAVAAGDVKVFMNYL